MNMVVHHHQTICLPVLIHSLLFLFELINMGLWFDMGGDTFNELGNSPGPRSSEALHAHLPKCPGKWRCFDKMYATWILRFVFWGLRRLINLDLISMVGLVMTLTWKPLAWPSGDAYSFSQSITTSPSPFHTLDWCEFIFETQTSSYLWCIVLYSKNYLCNFETQVLSSVFGFFLYQAGYLMPATQTITPTFFPNIEQGHNISSMFHAFVQLR